MLPAGSRLRRREEFLAALRQGRRGRGGRPAALLVHVHVADVAAAAHAAHPDSGALTDMPPTDLPPTETNPNTGARVGFVVSRAVGPAVVRNRVRRRLRHLSAVRLDRMPPGSHVVVRALPAAAASSYAQLGAALDAALDLALRPPRDTSAAQAASVTGGR